jgi:hypothetical protein
MRVLASQAQAFQQNGPSRKDLPSEKKERKDEFAGFA